MSRFDITYQCLDLLLKLMHVRNSAHDVEEVVEQPEHVVDVVTVLNELLVVLPESDVVEEQRVVCQEVDDQRKV